MAQVLQNPTNPQEGYVIGRCNGCTRGIPIFNNNEVRKVVIADRNKITGHSEHAGPVVIYCRIVRKTT